MIPEIQRRDTPIAQRPSARRDAVAQGAKEFETVVQSGVAALLKIVTRKLEDQVAVVTTHSR